MKIKLAVIIFAWIKLPTILNNYFLNFLNIFSFFSDAEVRVDPVPTIRFIAIKTNNVQNEVNIDEPEKIDLKFSQQVSL